MNSTETTRIYLFVILLLVLLGSMKHDKTGPCPVQFGKDPRATLQTGASFPD